MRLLDEMGSLAEGDLTVKTTVTEDITGAIADSVNYAIDELRTLVTTINETSEQVSSSAQETQTTARHLAESRFGVKLDRPAVPASEVTNTGRVAGLAFT